VEDARAGVQFKNVMEGICGEGVTEVIKGRALLPRMGLEKIKEEIWKTPLGFAFAGQPRRLSPRELWRCLHQLLRFPFDDAATQLK
jgi:hypothetical protein